MSALPASVRVWAEMVKLSHSVFALPFAVMAAFLAGRGMQGRPRPHFGQMVLVVLCMVAARSVAMTFNRIVDAELDARNPRTEGRPLPAGRLTHYAARLMLLLSAVTFGIGCLGFQLLYGNPWPIAFSGPVLIYLCGYSFTKRFTRWSHVYLGSAVALSPVAAWLAIHPPSLGVTAFLLMGTVTCWVAGFDIIYACQDIAVDRRDYLHSLPAELGPGIALRIARMAHGMALLGLVAVGVIENLGKIYALGVAMTAVLLVVENLLVRPGYYARVNTAFFTMNGAVSLILAGTTIAEIFRTSGEVM